ncbi:glycerophosphodiester phosphodiesterase family protein [Marinilactibacillus sp. Marseille-P9653]|uniref:glycerophosphodiester phosphodiesterase n=1 Tax=Marinilactibacillus sp. Marseille-P9653 TaxID=2866583 RepID=UPI001CE3FA59|nr:glycerophosphodiester phosphodiesterase family protein [Marinilactibacillus sp. Marseille-P9653]
MKSLNYAHRGFSGEYPENTMIAFEKALEAGADGIELDVQLTSDKEVVVFHDDKLDRLTNGSGFVKDHTLEELNQLSFDVEEREGAENYKIPTLNEYLEWSVSTPLLTNIELKALSGEDNGLEQKVVTTLRSFNCMNQILFSSFHEESLARIKQLAPEAQTGLLVLDCSEKEIQKVYEMGIDCIHPLGSAVNETVVKHIHKMGLKINVWTINVEASIKEALANEVDGLITDYPNRVSHLQNNKVTH